MLVCSCTKYKVQCTTNNVQQTNESLFFCSVFRSTNRHLKPATSTKNCTVQKFCNQYRNLFPEICKPVQKVWNRYSNLKPATSTKICLLASSTEIKKKRAKYNVQSTTCKVTKMDKYNVYLQCIFIHFIHVSSSMYLHPFQQTLITVLKVHSNNFHTVTAGSSPIQPIQPIHHSTNIFMYWKPIQHSTTSKGIQHHSLLV